MFKKITIVLASAISLTSVFIACRTVKPQQTVVAPATTPEPRILVFSKTKGFHHESIPDGIAAIQKLGLENHFLVDTTTNAAYFVEDSLKNYAAVVFLSTTGDVLNADQQVAFERFIEAGGGYMGIHAAADTEYDWPWYNKLAGAYFLSHPKQQNAVIQVKDKSHVATSFLPDRWQRFDEWYNYKSIQPDIKVLATLDESSYQGGQNGDNHPIIWYHDFDGGRAFYTGIGHTKESYTEPLFLKHILGGIQYAIGNNRLDYTKSYAVRPPEDNRFTKTILSNDLNEPMELAVAPDGRVFFTERAGKFYMYDPVSNKTRLLRAFPVKAVDKYLNGLIGITLDPDFRTNNYIYFFYTSSTGTQLHQNVSRFRITADNNLDTSSEKILIKIPIDAEVSAHTGGSLAWDRNKNLYISTGDNTTPFESDGFAPIDERPGRLVFDAQRSAGNANDLRGKILRIHPEPDGTYTIPEGNLFTPGTPGTKPEIYVMGCRNPYRISVDPATSFVYWGEVGPDAGRDSRHGPRGYDEFNQARKAGNFGWPYFVGNSQAYHDSDFATKEIGPLFDINGPTNSSPNNTGMKQLPPPQSAMVWYPYARSEEFPDLGQGGRCAIGGPVYHFDPNLKSDRKLPAYYDKALFVADWMRNWVLVLRLDENYNYRRMEPFMRTNGDFRRPIDMEIGPDGAIYMLEYGSVYGIDNVDARLVRIDYNEGDRAPIAKITTNDTLGLAPLTVAFSSKASYDNDEDDNLSYQWTVNNQVISTEPDPAYTFSNNGIYTTVLKVTDRAGKSSTDTTLIKVGNTMPKVAIETTDNSTFFFDKSTALNYNVRVEDHEDKVIDKKKVKVALKYIPKVAPDAPLVGHQQIENYNYGKVLIASSDCKACHQLNAKSVGPSFMDVSRKYFNDKNAVGTLANKIITGGSGVWGQHAMSAHPQISKDDAMEIVKYVLSVSSQQKDKQLPQAGTAVLKEHVGTGYDGRYIITASYTDNGGAITPLTGKDVLVLRPSRVQAESADMVSNMQKTEQGLRRINNRSYFVLRNIDLKEVDHVTYHYASKDKDATIEIHTDAVSGPMISTGSYKATGAWDKFEDVTAPVTDPGGRHDLYFVFVKNDAPDNNLATLDWLSFDGGREVIVKEPAKPVHRAHAVPTASKASTSGKISGVTAASKKLTMKSPGQVLIARSDCNTCHRETQKQIGPAFVSVAKRYHGDPNAMNKLTEKIIKGGSGNWGQVPMAPHPQLSRKEATEIVHYILSLK